MNKRNLKILGSTLALALTIGALAPAQAEAMDMEKFGNRKFGPPVDSIELLPEPSGKQITNKDYVVDLDQPEYPEETDPEDSETPDSEDDSSEVSKWDKKFGNRKFGPPLDPSETLPEPSGKQITNKDYVVDLDQPEYPEDSDPEDPEIPDSKGTDSEDSHKFGDPKDLEPQDEDKPDEPEVKDPEIKNPVNPEEPADPESKDSKVKTPKDPELKDSKVKTPDEPKVKEPEEPEVKTPKEPTSTTVEEDKKVAPKVEGTVSTPSTPVAPRSTVKAQTGGGVGFGIAGLFSSLAGAFAGLKKRS